MTTPMPLSVDKETNRMPNKPTPAWKQYVTPGLLVTSIAGGVPWIDSMQTKLDDARERTIRLEVKVETLSEDLKSMKATIEAIRSRLEARGIVHRVDGAVGEVAGEKHTSK